MKDSKLLFIGWEGADWRFIQRFLDDGLMPNLDRLVKAGTIGKVHSIEPNMSTTLWASMFTGKRPYKHELIGLREYDDQINYVKPITRNAMKCHDIWEIMEHLGKIVHRIGLNPSHPAISKGGICISNLYTANELSVDENGRLSWPLNKDSVFPIKKSLVFAPLRVYRAEINHERFDNSAIFGESEKLERNAHIYKKIIADSLSYHSAATYILENDQWDTCSIIFDGIERMSFQFLDDGIDDLNDIQEGLMKHVYELFDHFLGQLMKYVSDRDFLVVCSEYGYDPIRIRNRPRNWDKSFTNRSKDNGFFAINGPGIKADYLINNLNILDIAPTILNLLEIPAGRDMDGKVLNFLTTLPDPVFIPSWEPEIDRKKEIHDELDRQLNEMSSLVKDGSEIQDLNHRNFYFWLARSYADDRKFDAALSLTKKLHELYPAENRFIYFLSKLYGLTDQTELAESILSQLSERSDFARIKSLIAKGNVLYNDGKTEKCTEVLINAEVLADNFPEQLAEIGYVHMQLSNWSHAERLLKKSLKIHKTNYKNLTILSKVYLGSKRYVEAKEIIDRAIAIKQYQPRAHFHKAELLLLMGDIVEAIKSYEIAVSQNSLFQRARLALINLYKDNPQKIEFYNDHLKKFRSLLKGTRYVVVSGNLPLLKEIAEVLDNKSQSNDQNMKNVITGCRFLFRHTKIRKTLSDLENKILFTVPKFLFDLDPKFFYRIVYIKPNPTEMAENSPKINEVKAREIITGTEQRLTNWAESCPHITLTIQDTHEFSSDKESATEKLIQFVTELEVA